jgi:hypothetical protein
MPPINALQLSSIVLLMMASGCTTTGGVALRPDGTLQVHRNAPRKPRR